MCCLSSLRWSSPAGWRWRYRLDHQRRPAARHRHAGPFELDGTGRCVYHPTPSFTVRSAYLLTWAWPCPRELPPACDQHRTRAGRRLKPLKCSWPVTLAPTFYGHFYTEHNRGHHVRVATRKTPPAPAWVRASGRSARARWPVQRPLGVEPGARAPAQTRPAGLAMENGVLSAWMYSVVLWGAMIAWLGWAVVPFP